MHRHFGRVRRSPDSVMSLLYEKRLECSSLMRKLAANRARTTGDELSSWVVRAPLARLSVITTLLRAAAVAAQARAWTSAWRRHPSRHVVVPACHLISVLTLQNKKQPFKVDV